MSNFILLLCTWRCHSISRHWTAHKWNWLVQQMTKSWSSPLQCASSLLLPVRGRRAEQRRVHNRYRRESWASVWRDTAQNAEWLIATPTQNLCLSMVFFKTVPALLLIADKWRQSSHLHHVSLARLTMAAYTTCGIHMPERYGKVVLCCVLTKNSMRRASV
jgi:hypothetical protein